MSKLWVMIVREYAQVVKKKSFLIGIILTPALMVGLTVLPAMLATKKPASTQKIAVIDLDGRGIGTGFSKSLERYKLDDKITPAYEVAEIYELLPDDSAGLSAARKKLDSLVLANELRSYLVINPRAEENDSVIWVAKSFNFTNNARFERRISDVLSSLRLTKSSVNLETDSVLTLTRRIELMEQAPGGKKRDFMTLYFGGLIFVFIIFMTVIGYGQILMRSVIEEKNSRIIEVMVSSVSPFQLMAGKIIGLGLASLTQLAVWVVIGLFIYATRGSLNISADISGVIFNPVLITFFILYLLVGYILYSTIFAFIGSICNSDKESQNFIFPVTMSLMLPMVLGMYVIQEPDGLVTVILSLIPFFTPTMMIMRMNIISPESFSFANPVVLHAVIGLVLTIATTLGVIWFTSRVFRIGILMYGKRPTLPEILKWIRYK